jgi:capsular exopolysaccharide synthesis family protein
MIMRQRKWWIIGAALLGLAVSLVLSLTQVKEYSATAQLLVQPSGQAVASGLAQPVTSTDVQTEIQLVTSAPVQQAVQRLLGSHPAVSAFQVAQTNVISITAIAAIPAQAARIANTYAQAFVSYERTVVIDNSAAAESQIQSQIQSISAEARSLRAHSGHAAAVTALLNEQAVLKQQLSQLEVSGAVAPGGVAAGGVELVTPALAPTSPSSPKPARDALLGLLAGLVLGLGAAFLRHNLDDAVTSKEGAEQVSGSPVLGLVPMVTSWKSRKQPLVVSSAKPTSPAAESYRSLRTSLQFARQERDLRTLLVTSPTSSEGKTTTLVNLGAVFAQAGERVVLVSGDLRRPRIGQFFGLDEVAGLTSVLLGQRSLEQVLQPVDGFERLCVLAAGPVPPNPAELLSGPGMHEIFAALREEFDLILIDSPPVLPVTDAMVLSSYADGTLLVLAAGQTKRAELERASEKFSQANAPVVGIVLNQVTKQGGYGSRYGTGYGSYLADTPADGPVHPNGDSAAASTTARHGRGRQ